MFVQAHHKVLMLCRFCSSAFDVLIYGKPSLTFGRDFVSLSPKVNVVSLDKQKLLCLFRRVMLYFSKCFISQLFHWLNPILVSNIFKIMVNIWSCFSVISVSSPFPVTSGYYNKIEWGGIHKLDCTNSVGCLCIQKNFLKACILSCRC